MAATLNVVDETAEVKLDGFRLGYVAEDGTQRRLSSADAWVVRFEAMSPARRYRGPWTPAVHTLLRHLERVGFDAAPRLVGSGLDPDGREMLTYIDGEFTRPGPRSCERDGPRCPVPTGWVVLKGLCLPELVRTYRIS